MSAFLSHIIEDQHLVLTAERSIFWENERTLIIADLHIGKTGHFRKAGIGVPGAVYKDDLHRLLSQVLFFKADRLIIVGDLSHSTANRELELFRKWRSDFSSLEVHLARGNHDILDRKWYEESQITVHNDPYIIDRFHFVHDVQKPLYVPAEGEFVFSGHVHPSVTIRGRGRQALQFPCFYFESHGCILPAFSRFTGSYNVRPGTTDKVYALVEKEIIPL